MQVITGKNNTNGARQTPVAENQVATASHEASPKLKHSPLRDLHLWLRDVVMAVGLALLIVIFLYQPVRVEGVSMMPDIRDQERIFVNKFIYRVKPIQRGDVIVFSYPLDARRSFIKRVIGLPGETVLIRNGRVFINGRELKEEYVARKFESHEDDPAVIVAPDHFYVLGDHRNSSNDSRAWGVVPRKNIYGKAVFRYWPLDEFGLIH